MSTQLEALRNYRNLVAKIDEFCRRITVEYADSISCRKGCDDCCRHISIFPVEALSLAMALHQAPAAKSVHIRKLARSASMGTCPLLDKGICLLYPARPIICRTHGFPLLMAGDQNKILDYCPRNFNGMTTFPAAAVVDLDILNSTLAAINDVFIASRDGNVLRLKDRFPIAEALLLDL